MNDELTVEVCVDSLESAVAAERGGAKRVELCSALPEGGTTPSAGLIAAARKKVSIPLHVMIRPRAGDFYYSAEEFSVMSRDVLTAKQLGVGGVVFGILDLDGKVDIPRTRQLVDLARPLQATFHRAFDMSASLLQSLEDVVEAGVDRILTSGGAQSAIEAVETLRELVLASAGRVIVMAGGGIDDQNVEAVVKQTGVQEVHVGLRTPIASPMRFVKGNISMGTIKGQEYQRSVVTEDSVKRLLRAAGRI